MAGTQAITARSRRRFLLVVVAVVVVLGGMWALLYGLRSLRQALVRQNEAAARQNLSTLNQALRAYHEKYGGYPGDLRHLRGGEEGSPETAPPEKARLLDTSLAHNRFERDGYRFRYRAGQLQQRWAATVQLYGRYRVTAEPLSPGGNGGQFYYTDPSGEVRFREGEDAGPDDPVVQPE